jgi:predicted negative regulator of RcsB-dependent stress response
MEIYNSEQDQVEALKAWWDKNGRITIVAIVLVLLGVLGWKSWVQNQNQRAEAASVQYQHMLEVLEANPGQAMELGRAIVSEHSNSLYAVLASMAMAKAAVQQQDLNAAEAHLRLALGKAGQAEVKQLAQLRLASVLHAQGKSGEALSLLASEAAPGFRGSNAELRGDILLAQGKPAAARDAYNEALSGYTDAPEKRTLVQMKLDDLAESNNE